MLSTALFLRLDEPSQDRMVRALRTLVRIFVAFALGALTLTARADETRPTDALESLNTTRATYLVVYRHGPNWVDGKPLHEQQSMREHFRYYLDLHRDGLLIAGGGFTDGSGGAAVFQAADDAAAAGIIAADPAVKSKVFSFELQQWKPNPWEEISKRSAARGE